MAEERLKQFYEDRKAMVDILSKHGLLLELPEYVFKRNVKANYMTFASQVEKLSWHPSYTKTVGTAVAYIRRLGNMPDGRLKAIELLLEAADRYCAENGEWNFKADWYYSGANGVPHVRSCSRALLGQP